MSSQAPAPKEPSGVSGGPVVLVLAAAMLALFLIWHWFPVSIAVAPSSARSAKDVEAVAAQLAPPQGFTVNAYAIGLGEARVMVFTSKGDVILSSPPHRVLLVKADNHGNGRSDGVETLIEKLENPSGLFLDGNQLYIAEDSRVLRVGFDADTGKIAGTPETILPDLPRNGMHWTRTIKKGPDGFFYVSIGASCNVCVETNPWRAGIIRFKPGEKAELYASGLRNTVGFDWQPGTNALYGVDNGRDWLGDNLPPEEVNQIKEGGFYGWPNLYGDNKLDPDFGKEAPDRTSHAIPPVYEVVVLHWWEGQITEEPFLTGFLTAGGDVLGRPVDIIESPDDTIFISDERRKSQRLRSSLERLDCPQAPRRSAHAYAVYVDDTAKVWVSDFTANAILSFDPKNEAFESFPSDKPDAAVRELNGRAGEVWGAESGADRLVAIRTARLSNE